MTPDEQSRLASQRRDDLEDIRQRDLDRERERGRREASETAHTAEQDRHIGQIDASITSISTDVQALKGRLEVLEKAFGEFAAISKALAEKGVSTRTFILGVIAVLIPIIVLFISSGKHP